MISKNLMEYYEMGEDKWGALRVTSKWIMMEMRKKPREEDASTSV